MSITSLIFFFGSIIGISLGVIATRLYKNAIYLIFALLVISTCADNLSINLASRATYREATRGFEVHFADLCVIIMIIAMLLRPTEYKIHWFLPLTIPYAIFFFISIISWLTIMYTDGYAVMNPYAQNFVDVPESLEIGLYPLFEMHKVIRGFLLYWTVANFFNNKKTISVLLTSIAIILLMGATGALINRYVFGEYRSTFLLDVNIFNCYTAMLGAFVSPFIFQTPSLMYSLILLFIATLALVCVILTVSRAALMGLLFATFVTSVTSVFRYKKKRNFILIGLSFVLAFGMLLKAQSTLNERFFENEPEKVGMKYREYYNQEAVRMSQDHFLGVGLGNFSAFSQEKYGERSGDPEIGTMAHNIWYLTLGETGWIGLLAFIFIWLRTFQILFASLLNKNIYADAILYATALGILGALIVLHLQSFYHFAYRVTPIYFLTQIFIGLLARIYLSEKKKWAVK